MLYAIVLNINLYKQELTGVENSRFLDIDVDKHLNLKYCENLSEKI